MKNPIRFVGLLLLAGVMLPGITSLKAEETPRDYVTDFAVPDAPAYLMVDTSGSVMLRPTSLRDFAVGLSDVWESDQPVALEIAPIKLFKGRGLSLSGYQANPWLYRMKLSLATSGPLNSPDLVAVGIRVTPQDHADLLADEAATTMAQMVTDSIQAIVTAIKRREGPMADAEEIRQRPEVKAMTKPLEEAYRRQVIEQWEETSWNAGSLSFAVAMMMKKFDTTSEAISFKEATFWATKSFRLEDWGQLLLGGRASMIHRDSLSNELWASGTVSSRLYAGFNSAKILFETQFTGTQDFYPEWLLNFGGEARIQDDFWVEVTYGVKWSDGADNPAATSSVRFKLAM